MMLARQAQRLHAVLGLQDVVAVRFQQIVDELHVQLVVLHNQHGLRRACLFEGLRCIHHVACPARWGTRYMKAQSSKRRHRQLLNDGTIDLLRRRMSPASIPSYSDKVNFRYALAKASLSCAAYGRSEEHTSELQSLMRISYAVFCLKKKQSIIIKQK